MFAIVDLETTGVRANQDRIIEIAIVLYDGQKIVNTYQTLIDPERSIPNKITQITGITNEMILDAPKFYEVAKKVVEMTKGAIFVAHNVQFDYAFLKEAFARLRFTFRRKQLCTIRLSKITFPNQKYYNLGAMTRFLNIKVNQRHRAMGDALATTKLLKTILQKESKTTIKSFLNNGVKASKLPINFTLEQLQNLPEQCGIYYFHNRKGEVIYVGKSINIKKRITEHFANNTSKANSMKRDVFDITHQVTGSELIALLLESHEIKTIKPRYNSAQKPRRNGYCIFRHQNAQGYTCLSVARRKKTLNMVGEFNRQAEANSVIRYLQKDYNLCLRYCDLQAGKGPCFDWHLHQCKGACCGRETVEAYNKRVEQAIEGLKIGLLDGSYLVLEGGRTKDEQGIVLIENGEYRGFGYADKASSQTLEDLRLAVRTYDHNSDTVKIIAGYLRNNKRVRKISF